MGAIVCTKCRNSHLLPSLDNNNNDANKNNTNNDANNNNDAHLIWKCSCGFVANSEKVTLSLRMEN